MQATPAQIAKSAAIKLSVSHLLWLSLVRQTARTFVKILPTNVVEASLIAFAHP
jgi:hypothetical protein